MQNQEKNLKRPQETVTDKVESDVSQETAVKEASYSSDKTKYILFGGLIGLALLLMLIFGSMVVIRLRNQTNLGPRNMMIGRVYNFGHRGFANANYSAANRTSGKVTNVNGSTFTVDVNGQTKTIQISATTLFPLNLANKVNVNDQVVVWGLQDSAGVVQANRIAVNPPASY